MKINILIIKFSYKNIGGVDRQILRIAKELNNNSFKTMLATNDRNSPLALEFIENGGEVFSIDFNNISLLAAANKISDIVQQKNVHIIQSHLFRESIICRLVKFKNSKVKHLFRVQTFIDCAWIPNWKKYFYHLLDYISSKYVNIYIANGPLVEKEIICRSRIPKNKVVDIINGTEKIGEPDVLCDEILPNKIAMVANLLEKKGHDVLIKALCILKAKGLIINVRIIGAEINGDLESTVSPFKNELINIANEHGVIDQIEFYGYTKNISLALNNIPIVVLPSDSEGVPNCILEAMSLKKIVIASDVGAVSTLIEDGKTGFLHAPQKPEQFAQILLDVFSMNKNKLNEISQCAYNKWQTSFTLEIMIRKLLTVYKTIYGGNAIFKE